ncbi:MAG: histidine triad nucleotide-binding protein [Firmicutes bacterium]|nr:histidine triad nucleotide-binding protein [Bacillota bacterium]
MSGCIFCRIVSGEIPSQKIYEDDRVIAFKDINPRAPVHLLVVPRKHLASVLELGPEDSDLGGHVLHVLGQLARQEDLAGRGFRIVSNCGQEGGQTVDHLHFHLLGGRRLGAMG